MFSQTAQRKQTSWHYETLQSERDEKERLPLRVWKPCLQTLHTSPWQEWHAYAIGCCFNCLVATDVILHRQDSLLKQRHCAIALWYPLWWNMSACIGSSKLGCQHRYDPCYLDTKRIPKHCLLQSSLFSCRRKPKIMFSRLAQRHLYNECTDTGCARCQKDWFSR